jgi:hypothetical protein
METLKAIINDVMDRLQEVDGIKYVDKNWGQLMCDPPAVKYPCALVDIGDADYENLGSGEQVVSVVVNIEVSVQRLTPSSNASKRRVDSYADLELLGKIHNALHLYGTDKYQPLLRIRFYKEDTEPGVSTYRVMYRTAYITPPVERYEKKEVRTVRISPSLLPDAQ